MPKDKFETREEYVIKVEFSTEETVTLDIDLTLVDTPKAYALDFIDQVLHCIPDSIYLNQLINKRNGWQDKRYKYINNVYIVNTRFPGRRLPVVLARTPLPKTSEEVYANLNHYRWLDVAQSTKNSEISKKWTEMDERYESSQETLLIKTFISEVAKSYRLRRDLTLQLFYAHKIPYETPGDLIPPPLEDTEEEGPEQIPLFR